MTLSGYANMLGSQLCLNFSRYFFGLQAPLYEREYLKAQKHLCYTVHGPREKNILRNLLFPKGLTLAQKDLCGHKGGEYGLA
ncbi:hypothetical protein A3L04_06335 [Thermococcus chitonophagus]|uniref:Uncharacterized protein n=1 Tax=Thermococcus chitonophagus TaxID=54262 RepID=A0A2Z2N3M4_9EURY|nr:hypothetical protein A3L04_06335 [Thermococcus chitonophagus]